MSMKLTIEKFQQLYAVSTSDMTDLDKSIAFIQIVSGKSQTDIESMKVSKFNKECKKVNDTFAKSMEVLNNSKPSNWFWVGGKLYYINYDIKQLSANKYVEVATFAKDIIGNLHKILASMVYETKWTWKGVKILPYTGANHEKVSERMLKADFKVAYNTALFFYLLFNN
jgi:hypothetical protein